MGSFFARPQSFSFFSFLAQRKRTMRFMLKWNNPLCFHPPTSEEKSLPTFVFLTPTRSSCTLWIQYSIVSHMQSRKLFKFFDDSLFSLTLLLLISLDVWGTSDMQRKACRGRWSCSGKRKALSLHHPSLTAVKSWRNAASRSFFCCRSFFC